MTLLGTVRPDAWNLPLFLHVLGAMTLVGSVATVIILAAAARQPQRALLARGAFRVALFGIVPSWLVMRVCAQWTVAKEHLDDSDATWLGIGYLVGDAGLLLVLATTGIAYWWSRRGGAGGWQRPAILGVAAIYLVALAVAWWSMAAKFGA